MSEWFALDASGFEAIQEAMAKRGEGAGRIIDSVLHREGAEEIKQDITRLLPSSGRSWKGKGAPASAAMPGKFSQDNGTLSVTVAARGKYHYLYFPDDGSNTKRHAGDHQFMRRGAENASERIIEMCIGKLVD